ncbi:methyltransferase domain-containing protein [Parvularcula sp. ZS-1/3]|uniref:Methyltransferase domain-containing protein n=1 Tax=Parvularcula mediterranea TaxID=2732508 RepID=A0A7Y3W5S9_9PROT|nr:class I SAM-dependent methyltransferase [Parvularcula mediterranea]NNU16823.1 methyltransferase domain-containing protein [Parvularcula mediterranea]
MKDATFWDRMAEKYFAKPIDDQEAYETKLRLTQEHLSPDAEVLEIGCGTGGTALRHAAHAKHIHAVDFSSEMIRIGREQAARDGVGNVSFEVGDAVGYEAEREGYDAVLALSVLHLLREPGAFIAKAASWLKPGGVLVSSTACLGDNMAWFKLVGPVGRAVGKMPYLNVFKEEDLLGMHREAGLTIETHWKPGTGPALFLIAKKAA